MAEILLTTLNSRYSHASFGLRYLRANAGAHRARTQIVEFTIHQPPLEIVERLLAEKPALIGFGVYIWNVRETTQIIGLLKRLRPEITVVIGGPEVSFEYEETPIFALADHLVTGEGDHAFRELLDALAAGQKPPKVIAAAPPEPASLALPYDEYTDEDLRNRLIYVEASRGCPFTCEFCLSSLEVPVRAFPLEPFLAALDRLLVRGARAFKFVDRTFNLNVKISAAILRFCLARYREGFELHFEMIPDRLPGELRELVTAFPPGAVQFEIGIQTLTEEVMALISRRQNLVKTAENLAFLTGETTIHIHADLIFGLPGETLATFASSFNRLFAMRPGEIQLGILKRLRGAPISRHTEGYGLKFSPEPPYEILETSTVPFEQMQRMKRFARYFELYHNSGNFTESLRELFGLGGGANPFEAFLGFADFLYAKTGQTHQFGRVRLYELLFEYLTGQGVAPQLLAQQMLRDYDRQTVRKERLEFLRPHVPAGPLVAQPA